MNKEVIFVIALIGCFIVTYLYQKKIQEELLKKLYNYKIKKDKKNFMKTLESISTKLIFSKFTIEFMKFNYYLEENNYKELKKQYQQFKDIKMNDQNMIALNLKMFNCALEVKDYSLASNIKEILLPAVKKQKGNDYQILAGEIEQLDRIYIQKDTTIINELIDTLKLCEENEVKSLICFRLAKLYSYLDDKNKVNEYLLLAKKYTSNEENKMRLHHLMLEPSELN